MREEHFLERCYSCRSLTEYVYEYEVNQSECKRVRRIWKQDVFCECTTRISRRADKRVVRCIIDGVRGGSFLQQSRSLHQGSLSVEKKNSGMSFRVKQSSLVDLRESEMKERIYDSSSIGRLWRTPGSS